MKLHHILDDLLDTRSKICILRIVFKFPEREFTENEIAGLISMSPNTINLAMKDLRRTNIFIYRRVGHSHSYKCNSGSILFQQLKILFENEIRNRESLFELLKTRLKGVGTVMVFGSFARNEEDFESDLDLLIVSKNKDDAKDKLEETSNDILLKYSIMISPVFYTPRELVSNHKKAFIKKALSEGIYVVGNKLKIPK